MSARAIRSLARRVKEVRTLGAKALLLRLIIGHREDEAMRCSISALARELGVKRDTVSAAFEALAREGLVHVVDGLVILRLDEPRPENQAGEIVAVGASIGEEDLPGQRAATCPASGQKLPGQRAPFKEEEKKSAREEIGYVERFARTAGEAEFCRMLARSGLSEAELRRELELAKGGVVAAKISGGLPAWIGRDEAQSLLWAWRRSRAVPANEKPAARVIAAG